jgi:vancomycin resistance protein YoaR
VEEKKKDFLGEQSQKGVSEGSESKGKGFEEDTLFLFDQWSTEENDQKEEQTKSEPVAEESKEKKEEDDTDLLIFSQWDTSDSQPEAETAKEEISAKETEETQKESEPVSEKDEKDLEETREFKIREVTAKTGEGVQEDNDLLFGSASEQAKKEKPVVAAPLAADTANEKPLENPFKPDQKDNVVFFDKAFEPTETKTTSQATQPNTPPPFTPANPPSPQSFSAPQAPPAQAPKTPPAPVEKRSKKKWLAGLVAAGLLLFGGVATYSFAQTDYYRQEIEPIFIGYNVTLQANGKNYTFDLEQFGYDGDSAASIDKRKLALKLDQIREEVDQPASPAKFTKRKLGTDIVPERVGNLIDTEKVVSWFKDDQTVKSMLNQPRKLPMIEDKPTFVKEDLENVDKELIGTFTTNMGATSGARVTNIRVASKTITEMVLRPGEQFSWNGYVGNTTADKGYQPAGAIVNKKLVMDYGGGICQVSSTLFNAVEKAGLKVIERSSHSLPVGYVPPGRDATIAYPYKDFKFANNLDKPIVIKVDASSHLVTVKVYSVPGAKALTKQEMVELMYPEPKTSSFKKLLLGFDENEQKREKQIQELLKADDEPYVQITDGDMMDVPLGEHQDEIKLPNQENSEDDDTNSL